MTLEPTIDPASPALAGPSLRAVFDERKAPTIGVEEELMLLHPQTLDLQPSSEQALAVLAGDTRFKPELVAAQIETVTPPRRTVGDAAQVLREARRDLLAALDGGALVAGAGVHPFAAGLGELHSAARYTALAAEFASIARRQLVFGLHVHVAVTGAERAVAVHDALRSYLPDLAGLAANAPFHEGRDRGLASVRPTISGMLPRQGVPPVLGSWNDFERALSWGEGAGILPGKRRWWWELRLHPTFGTIEVRVGDTQTTVAETAAYAAVVHALVTWLAERAEAGETLPVAPTWRIAENRWLAARDGLEASLVDLETGAREPLRERLERLFDELAPVAARMGCAAELERARALAAGPGGAARQREEAARGGLDGLTAWLAGQLLA
ncbi:MAG: glutamate---cysteine ligase / carboxylate-amine ligase [Candidatus Eremiobacteraeota bacterium]|nr:glutamate---cysteine ligase / carboxylate-amine ligase [Candidatus Eremiobacteraeota bacterium]